MSPPPSPRLLGRRPHHDNNGYHPSLNLEVISSRRVKLTLLAFYACIAVAWAGIFTAYDWRWQCTTLCLQDVSSDERRWDANALPPPLCRSVMAGTEARWDGGALPLDPLNVHLQLLLVVPNSPTLTAAVANEVAVSVSLATPTGDVSTNWTYPLNCPAGRAFCRSIGLHVLPNLTAGTYQATVHVYPSEVVTGADLKATTFPMLNAYPIMCHHTTAHTGVSVALRVLGFSVLLVVFIQFARATHWTEFWHWSPEQKWLLLLFLATALHLNPFYLGYLFVSDLSNAAGRTFLFFQGCSSWFYRYVQMGFEVVLLCCAQAFPFYICGVLHYGLLEGFAWTAGMIAVYVAYFTIHGFVYRTREFYISYLDWPPVGTFTGTDGFVCSIMLLFFVIFWYLWIFNLAYVTHRHLKAVPYLRKRPQQLSYRWFIACFMIYDVSWLVGYIYHLSVTDSWLPRLTLEDLPGANVLALPAVVAYTVVASTLFTPYHADMLNAPPHPDSRWWITVKWPQRWFDWMESHGRMLHFFRTEEERHRFDWAQKHALGELPNNSFFLSDLEHLQQDPNRAQLLRNNLVVMAEEARQGWDRLCVRLSPFNSFSPDADAEEGGADLRRTLSFHDQGAGWRSRPFFCVETAMKMWNLSWEVYWPEPVEFRPGRCTTAAVMAAAKAVPSRWEEGHQSRLQYLWNSRCTVAEAVQQLRPYRARGLPTTGEPNEAEVIAQFPEEVFRQWCNVQAHPLPDNLRRLCSHTQVELSEVVDATTNDGPKGPWQRWHHFWQKYHRPVYEANLMDPLSSEMSPTRTQPHLSLSGNGPDQPSPTWPGDPALLARERSRRWSGRHQPPGTPREAFSPLRRLRSASPDNSNPTPSNSITDTAQTRLPEPVRIARVDSGMLASENVRPSPTTSPLRGLPPLRCTGPTPDRWGSRDLPTRSPDFSVLEELLQQPAPQPPQRRILGNQKAMMLERYGYHLLWVLNRNYAQVLVAVSDTELGIAFRGTKNLQNVRADLRLHQEVMAEFVDPDAPEPFGACPWWLRWWLTDLHVPKAHAGFYATYRCLREDLLAAVVRFAAEYPHLPLYVTGHSLGGALATFFAYDIARLLPTRSIVMYNFGCPRVGNMAFKKLFTEQVPESFRVVNDCDVVPLMVPRCTPLGSVYHNVGKEVRIDPQGNMIIRPTVLERVFPTRKSRMLAHLMVNYRRSLEAVCHFYRVHLPRHVLPFALLETAPSVG